MARTGTAKIAPRVERPALETPQAQPQGSQEKPPPDPPKTGAASSAPLSPEATTYIPPPMRQAPSTEKPSRQNRDARNVRASTSSNRSEASFQAAKATDLERALRREENRSAQAFGASLPRVSEMPTPESMRSQADAMEDHVADIVSRVHQKSGGGLAPHQPIGEWLDVPISRVGYTPKNDLPSKLRKLPQGSYVLELSSNEVKAVFGESLSGDPTNTPHAHVSLLSSLQAVDDTPLNHKDAVRMGGKWTGAELKEINNHIRNGSWERISATQVPAGRSLHKLVWVFKVNPRTCIKQGF